ncbi:MAG: OmpA family protein [Deltaproteobacteria bacterium]|nr:OmpA family protein [Deltaproteobacteria bacterium]
MKTHFRRSLIFLIVLFTAFVTRGEIAHAQSDGEGISIETFKPSSSMNSIFETALPRPKDNLEWSLGGLISYAHTPMRRETSIVDTDIVEDEAEAVAARVAVDLYGALGLLGFAEIGLVIPVIAFQTGEGTTIGGSIQPAGIGDPRIELKARFLEVSGFNLGAGAIITAPIGHYASSGSDLLGNTTPTGEPKILVSYSAGPVVLALNAGFLLRPKSVASNYTQTHALTWNAAFGFDIWDFDEPGGLRLAVETNGEAGIHFDSLVETPMEALLGAKYRTEDDLILIAGAGPGMSTAVGTPAFRVFVGLAFDKVRRNCPAGPEDIDGFEDYDKCIDPDNDQDGILDVNDKCPDDPEDFDKFEDDDGCPETDNDRDTIPDKVDKCPMIPEDTDKFEDDDGCPEEGPGKATVKITDSQLLISSKIYFDFDKATIKEVSYSILDAVAEALNAHTHIKKTQIEGHTDNEGTEEYNQNLSEQRAKAVMDYLIGKKVQPERLTYKGYGFSKPKASNRTEEGKAINRRVEFTILDKE